jgi:hypothetical protein
VVRGACVEDEFSYFPAIEIEGPDGTKLWLGATRGQFDNRAGFLSRHDLP